MIDLEHGQLQITIQSHSELELLEEGRSRREGKGRRSKYGTYDGGNRQGREKQHKRCNINSLYFLPLLLLTNSLVFFSDPHDFLLLLQTVY
jgi:hypothetical protein